MTDLLALTEQLCAVPSVSGDEAALADLVEAQLRERAPEPRDHAARRQRGRPHATRRGDARRARRPSRHGARQQQRDPAPRRRHAARPRCGRHEGRPRGDAASSPTSLGRAPGSRDVTFVFYDGEEVADEHNGLRRLFAERPDLVACDMAVLLEPTGQWIEAGCQGTIHTRLTFDGARAHSARPWMGVNAVHRAAPMLARIAAYEAPTVTVDGLDYRESLQVVRVKAGIANNVVPDRCEIVVNRRYAPACSFEEALAQTKALFDDADEVKIVSASPAAAPNLTAPLISELVRSGKLEVRPKLGWTDVARFTEHGIPAVNFGPGDPELAHTADERVERADLEHCLRVLSKFVGV